MAKFSFNLLPKKSKDLIIKEKKRDSYSVYYTFLVAFGVVLWLGLVVFNSFVVDRSKSDWEKSNKAKENRINTEFAETRSIHGELSAKTNSIAPLLMNDIDPETIFKVAEQVFPVNEGVVTIVGYGRNTDGTFTISISAPNHRVIAERARQLRDLNIVTDLTVDKINQSPIRGQIIAVFNFSINTNVL